MPATLAQLMQAHLSKGGAAPEADALVFTSPGGRPMRYRNFQGRIWKPTIEALELPHVGIHALRHSGAANPRPLVRGLHADDLRTRV